LRINQISGRRALSLRSLRKAWRSRRGLASALIIMILVLLIFFAVLALVASAADLRLARKRADWNQQYFQADTAAVAFYAALDQYGRDLAREKVEPGQMKVLLESWLASRPEARECTLALDGHDIRLDLLVIGEINGADARQGIRMSLMIHTDWPDPAKEGTDQSPAILRWSQWQMPFDYNTDGSGIWEG
jgi:hypothetical protein